MFPQQHHYICYLSCLCSRTRSFTYIYIYITLKKQFCLPPVKMSGDSSDLPENWTSAPLPDVVKPLQWLLGTWKSILAEGAYPTISPFTYCEEITFVCYGQPLLNYSSVSWHPVKKCPMHLESGFLRIQPGTKNLAFMVAHNFGLTTLEEGTLTNENTIKLSGKKISRMGFAKDPEVTDIERTLQLVNGRLELIVNMKTTNTEMTQHLKAVYEKV